MLEKFRFCYDVYTMLIEELYIFMLRGAPPQWEGAVLMTVVDVILYCAN